MFKRLNFDKRKEGEDSNAAHEASKTGPQTEAITENPSPLTVPSSLAVLVASAAAASSPLTGIPLLAPSRLSASESLLAPPGTVSSNDPMASAYLIGNLKTIHSSDPTSAECPFSSMGLTYGH